MGVNQQCVQSYCTTTHHMTITLSSSHSQKRHPRAAGGRARPTQVLANRVHVQLGLSGEVEGTGGGL